MSHTEAIDYLRESANFLRTLGSLMYAELTQEQIESLKAQNLAALGGEEEGLMGDGFRGIGRYLSRSGMNVRQDLAVEYARIFLGAGVSAKQSAAPFESVFTSPEGLLMQDARDEVVATYRRYGTVIDPEVNVPEDHLGFELTFLGNMADKTADALATEPIDESCVADLVGAQVVFVDGHILNWIDALSEKVDEFAESQFYPSVMKLIKGYTAEYKEALGGLA